MEKNTSNEVFDPTELFDFLSRDDVGDLEYLNDLDLDVSLKGKNISRLSFEQIVKLLMPDLSVGSGLMSDVGAVSCDMMDTESDSGVESLNSVSPQDSPVSVVPLHMTSSPPASPDTSHTTMLTGPSTSLTLSSIQSMLPVTPLTLSELHNSVSSFPGYLDTIDTDLMEAVPPRLIKKPEPEVPKKPSLLSSLLSIPPVETKAAKQLRLQISAAQDDSFVNFLNSSQCQASGISTAQVDSFKQKDNFGFDLVGAGLRTVPSLENELMGIKYNLDTRNTDNSETQHRKKLIINKRKKELINMTGEIQRFIKSHQQSFLLYQNILDVMPWDGDLRVSMQPPDNCMTKNNDKTVNNKPKPNSRIFLCPTCNETFATSAARSLHRRQRHQRHHLCKACDKAFTTSQKLERHLKTTHKSDKKFQCEQCNKVFTCEENLESHYHVHFEKKIFKCPQCSCEFLSINGLNGHLQQEHYDMPVKQNFKCKKCEFSARTCLELEIHHEADHGATLITSNGCNQQFTDSGQDTLYELLLHSNENISQCPVNSLNAKAESQLEISMKAKPITKKFTCPHCGHKFAFKNSLTKHLSKRRCTILKKSNQQNCHSIQVS